VQPGSAALDIQELLRAQICAKARLGHNVVSQLQAQLGGNGTVAAVGNVGERPAVDDGGVMLQCLNKVRINGVFQKGGHRTRCADLPGRDRLAVVGVGTDNAGQACLQIFQVGGQAEHRHDLAGNGDIKAVLTGRSVDFAAQAIHDIPQLAVVHIHAALPGDAAGVDVQRVALLDGVVDHGRQQVVGSADGVDVAGKVQVDILHGHDLGIAAAGRAALDAEHRAEGRLTQAEHRLFAQGVHGVRQADAGGGLALTGGGGADGGHQNQLALGLVALGQLMVDLGLVVAVGDDVLTLQAQLGCNFGDGLHFGGLCNFDVAQHNDSSVFVKIKGPHTPYTSVCSPDGRLNAGFAPHPLGSSPQNPSVSGPAMG